MRAGACAIALTCALAASPALAADAARIGCVETTLGAAPVARIGERIIAAADAGTSLDAALDGDREAVIAARDACRKANGWSNDATDVAVSYLRARAAALGARAAIARDGLSVADVEATYTALPEAARRSFTGGKGLDPAARAAISSVRQAATVPAVRRHVTILYSALSAIEFYPGDFAAL